MSLGFQTLSHPRHPQGKGLGPISCLVTCLTTRTKKQTSDPWIFTVSTFQCGLR